MRRYEVMMDEMMMDEVMMDEVMMGSAGRTLEACPRVLPCSVCPHPCHHICRYGPCHPSFYVGSLADVVREAMECPIRNVSSFQV